MFSRRSLFIALGLALPLTATAAAEAATRRIPRKDANKAKPRRQRRAENATPPKA
jgi:hypothetical protein